MTGAGRGRRCGALVALWIGALAVVLSGCVSKMRIPDRAQFLRDGERVLEPLNHYRLELQPGTEFLPLQLERETSFEQFKVYRVQEIERRMWPRMAGVWYFVADVLMVKYLYPFGFGVYVVEQHFDKAKGVFLVLLPLTAFTYPLLVWVGGSVAGLFLYSPLTILYTPFGVTHRGIVEDFYDDKSKEYRAGLTYLQRIGDTALSWLPVYPGFTDKFGERERLLNEYEEERERTVVRRFEPISSLAATGPMEVRVNGARSYPVEERAGGLALPRALLDYFTEDGTIELELLQNGRAVATATHPAADFGVRGLVPRAFPDTPPSLSISVALLDSRPDGSWSAGEPLHLLIDITNSGRAPVYNLTYRVQGDAVAASRSRVFADGQRLDLTDTPLSERVRLLERLNPGGKLRVLEVFTLEEDAAALTLVIEEASGLGRRQVPLAPLRGDAADEK